MRRIRYGLVIIGVLGGLLVGTATNVGAGEPLPQDGWEITDSLDGYADVLELALVNEGEPCDDGTTVVIFVDEGEEGVLGQAPLSGANAGTVIVPDDLAETIFRLEISCEVGGEPTTVPVDGAGFLGYAGLDVTKAVEGDVPAGAEFVIEVDCEGDGEGPDAGPYDLVFAADGGTNRVWFSYNHDCVLTETDDGGAESTTIVSTDCEGGEGGLGEGNGAELVTIRAPVTCTATVTNVFAATSTTAAPTTTAPDGGVSPSTAAQPTTANPTFTG